MADTEANVEDEFAIGARSVLASTTRAKATERREGSAIPD